MSGRGSRSLATRSRSRGTSKVKAGSPPNYASYGRTKGVSTSRVNWSRVPSDIHRVEVKGHIHERPHARGFHGLSPVNEKEEAHSKGGRRTRRSRRSRTCSRR